MDTVDSSLKIDKTQESDNPLRRYWRAFIPLMILLNLMVYFPLRIHQRESFLDALFYGSISLLCIAAAIRVYRRFGKRNRVLIIVILLCAVLSSWQIFDMTILRLEGTSVYTFAGSANILEPLHNGWAWYGLRFPSDQIMCHSVFERYIGNNFIAIAYDINRTASWSACGG